MILEHEIPQGSKLYFGKSAKLKREIENRACDILYREGFEEISTPIFSYHTAQEGRDEKEILRLSNEQNFQIALRSDSTFDVVRIINKRIGRSTNHKRWFYLQPIFKYPTSEIYQIGVENLDSDDVFASIKLLTTICEAIELSPMLQVSNMQIPLLVAKECGLDMELFLSGNVEKILESEYAWLHELLKTQSVEQLEKVKDTMPDFLKAEIEKLYEATKHIEYSNVVIAPLYYSPIKYYDGIYFRMFEKNSTLAVGGSYICEERESNGFAIYTDRIIEQILEK